MFSPHCGLCFWQVLSMPFIIDLSLKLESVNGGKNWRLHLHSEDWNEQKLGYDVSFKDLNYRVTLFSKCFC